MIRHARLRPLAAMIFASIFAIAGNAHAASPERAAWERFKDSYISADGRVTDDFSRRTHSEGQGYAMLLAVMHDDHDTFLRVSSWTETHLKRDDGLYSWAWRDGAIEDANNATDGDILIAWAYLKAGSWDPRYYQSGLSTVARIREHLVVERDGKALLLPGLSGFDSGDGIVLNPSYWVFPALRDFARYDDARLWNEVIDTGIHVVETSAQGPWHMVPDWIEWPSARPWDERAPLSSYDAMRVPLYLVWAGYNLPEMDAWRRFWSETNRSWTNVSTGEFAPYTPQSEHHAIAMLVRRAGGETSLSLEDVPLGGSQTGYYSSVLTLLVQAAWTERFEP